VRTRDRETTGRRPQAASHGPQATGRKPHDPNRPTPHHAEPYRDAHHGNQVR